MKNDRNEKIRCEEATKNQAPRNTDAIKEAVIDSGALRGVHHEPVHERYLQNYDTDSGRSHFMSLS